MFTVLALTEEHLETVLAFDEYYVKYPPRKTEVLRAIRDQAGYLLKNDNTIIGYAIWRPFGLIEESFIHLIIIDRKYRGNGYAGQAIQYFESLTTTPRMHISTNVSNMPMQNVLKKLGYQEGGILKSIEPDDPEVFFYKQIT